MQVLARVFFNAPRVFEAVRGGCPKEFARADQRLWLNEGMCPAGGVAAHHRSQEILGNLYQQDITVAVFLFFPSFPDSVPCVVRCRGKKLQDGSLSCEPARAGDCLLASTDTCVSVWLRQDLSLVVVDGCIGRVLKFPVRPGKMTTGARAWVCVRD